MGNMKPIDSAVVKNETYDVLSADTMGGEYIETIGAACQNPDGYTSGSLFLGKDNDVQHLYRATAAIAFGETIILDTNCVYTTVSGELEGKAEESEVTSLNEALSNEVATRVANGAHNLLPNTASDRVLYGTTFTINPNKSITVTGQKSDGIGHSLDICVSFLLYKGTYILTDGLSDTDSLDIFLSVGQTIIATTRNSEHKSEFTLDSDTICSAVLEFRGSQGTQFNTIIYPMIRLASDPDTTYKPYAKTNRELTEDTNVENFTLQYTNATTNAALTIPYCKKVGKILFISGSITAGNAAISAGANIADITTSNIQIDAVVGSGGTGSAGVTAVGMTSTRFAIKLIANSLPANDSIGFSIVILTR